MADAESIVKEVQEHRLLALILLVVQFALCFLTTTISAPQILTNILMLFAICVLNKQFDKYEFQKLRSRWNTFHANRIKCTFGIFTLTFMAILRILLANSLDIVQPRPSYGAPYKAFNAHFFVQLIYYLVLVVCFSDNWTVFLSVLENDSQKKQQSFLIQNFISNSFFGSAPAA